MASEAVQSEGLESAFEAFNRHSSRLESAYRDLETRFSDLKAELAASRRARASDNREFERVGSLLVGLIEALPAAVIVLDGDGMICECNSRALRLLNTPLVGVAWSVVAKREFCRGASREGGLKLRSGQWLSLSRQALQDDQGEILLLADISEAHGNAELVRRAERLAAIGEMTARLGHQIRTPLASALLDTTRWEDAAGDDQEAIVSRVGNRLREIRAMVDDMLSYASGVTQSGDVVPVTRLFGDVFETIAPQLESGARLNLEIADESFAVLADREALKGALVNLVANALQACKADPVIELSAVRVKSAICLTVTDNGCGIPDEIRHRVFDPFFTTRPQGTGLGLAVVRAVAEAHGGEVLLQSGDNGTSISICIPSATDDDRPRGGTSDG